MTDVAATGDPRAIRDNLYAREVRFGVVMYGGVSLAIYINGVTNELYEMACATPRVGGNEITGRTRDVYRKASWLMRDQRTRERYLAYLNNSRAVDPFRDPDTLGQVGRTRFVVDTIAGTSAGGINGLFLAKALANEQPFAPLKMLWIREGDIGKLLNDSNSYDQLGYARNNDPPQSLLNSDRMYLKLCDAFRDMKTADASPAGGSSLADEIDLFITTTDIRGAVVPLRLFDKVVYERRYKQMYHFRYDAANGHNDLSDQNIPFLAFAARCTSSFPFAFEPMSLADAQRLWGLRPGAPVVDFNDWKPFFTGLSNDDMTHGGWQTRAFGDGGYLDNKPFSYVVESLSLRIGNLPMERKLVYVEPAPQHPELERTVFEEKPNAVENAVDALLSIPTDETIREDLEAVLARNRRIERVERIVRQVEIEIELRSEDPYARIVLENGEVPPWRSRDMRDMANYYGAAFLPYRQLRVMTVTDAIADQLALWWGITDQSDRTYALRAMARVWRDAHYFENKEDPRTEKQKESENGFLLDYDVKYYLRRTAFILRKVHQLLGLAIKLRLPEAERDFTDIENHLRERWSDPLGRRRRRDGTPAEVRAPRRLPIESMDVRRLIAALTCLAQGLGDAIKEIRKVVSLKARPAGASGPTADDCKALNQVLLLLLGEGVDQWPTELATKDGHTVRTSWDLPLPSPSRTLQENVYERAKKLYEYAEAASLTGLQGALEADIDALKKEYARVIDPTSETASTVEALLGWPELKVVPGPRVEVTVIPVELPGYVDCLNTPEGTALREFVVEYYMRFDEYDQVSFPLYYDTGTGEPSTVEVIRISPEDARSLVDEQQDNGETGHARRKLAGTALYNFGAFLDERWRRNDIMWGRLDGCERLLDIMFPAPADQQIKETLLQEAQRMIVREEMQPEGYDRLLDDFARALRARPDASLGKVFDEFWSKLPLAVVGQRRVQMAQALKAVLGDANMVDYVRKYYEVDRDLDTKSTLDTAARALTITGRVLEKIEKDNQSAWNRMVWLTRSGRALQVLLTISTPGSVSHAVSRHWLGLLYVFEIVIVGGAILFSSTAARNFGLAAFGVTAAFHLASLITGDLLDRRFRWLRWFATGLGATLLLLAFLGMMAFVNGGLRGIKCDGGHNAFGRTFDVLCQPTAVGAPHAPRPGG